jgi:hypothetical protein
MFPDFIQIFKAFIVRIPPALGTYPQASPFNRITRRPESLSKYTFSYDTVSVDVIHSQISSANRL